MDGEVTVTVLNKYPTRVENATLGMHKSSTPKIVERSIRRIRRSRRKGL